MRKVENVVVPFAGRDQGKIFRITEMPAAQAEKWALRFFVAIKGTSAFIPDEVALLGMVGIAIRGLNSILAADIKPEALDPLLDEMFSCVQIVRDAKFPDAATALIADDIEEVPTRMWLRSEVLRVHTGFSCTDALSALISAMKPGASETT